MRAHLLVLLFAVLPILAHSEELVTEETEINKQWRPTGNITQFYALKSHAGAWGQVSCLAGTDLPKLIATAISGIKPPDDPRYLPPVFQGAHLSKRGNGSSDVWMWTLAFSSNLDEKSGIVDGTRNHLIQLWPDGQPVTTKTRSATKDDNREIDIANSDPFGVSNAPTTLPAQEDIGTWGNIRKTRAGLYQPLSLCSLAELANKHTPARIIRLVNLPGWGTPHAITLIEQQDGQTTLIFESSILGLIQKQEPPVDNNTPSIKNLLTALAEALPWDTKETDTIGDDQSVILLEYYSKAKQGYTIKKTEALSESLQETLKELSDLRLQ